MSDGGVTKGGGSDGDAESRRGQKLAGGNFRGELLGQAGWEIDIRMKLPQNGLEFCLPRIVG